jgi:fructokinase
VGGVSANVAVTAARAGGDVALAGGAGEDAWGAWLRDRLAAKRVDLEWFELAAGQRTVVAFVTLDERGEPAYQRYGDGMAATAGGREQGLLDAVAGTDALFFGSNALAGKAEAALAMAARDRALELDPPVVFDPNVRLGSWDGNVGRAGSACGACVPGAFLVKCNQAEARMMTGEERPEAAAESLLAAGARHVIVTCGARGAILRAKDMSRDVAGRAARVLSTVGAGDVFLGVVLARLGTTDFYPPAMAAALPDAAEEAARACERWGALE